MVYTQPRIQRTDSSAKLIQGTGGANKNGTCHDSGAASSAGAYEVDE